MARKDWISLYQSYMENSEAPDSYIEWVAISVIAGALQRKCVLPWGILSPFYPNMYIILVGPPGVRKNTAAYPGRCLLTDIGVRLSADASSLQALIRQLIDATTQIQDTQTNIVKFHSSLTIYAEEFTSFIGYDNKQMIQTLTDWYDCKDPWKYETMARGIEEVYGVYVNLFGATTPGSLHAALPFATIASGLASRIIFIYEEQKKGDVVFPFSPMQEDIYKELRDDLEEINMISGEFTVTKDFLDVWEDWYPGQDVRVSFADDPNMMGYVARRGAHVMKLSMILSASVRSDRIITGSILQRSVETIERAEKKMPRTFSGVGTARNSAVSANIMDYIARVRKTTRARILTRFYADLEQGDRTLDIILNSLKKAEFCDLQIDPKTNNLFIIFNENSLLGKQYS